jgi:hypothetical protein
MSREIFHSGYRQGVLLKSFAAGQHWNFQETVFFFIFMSSNAEMSIWGSKKRKSL